MILNRIATALRRQDWAVVMIELVIVVAGILIAVQIDDWNTARSDAAQETEYLRRILAEFERDLERAEDRLASWRQVVASGDAALAYVESKTLVDGQAWPTITAFYFAGDVSGWRTEQETFNELRSAGRLGLISNEELRTILIRYAGARNTTYVQRLFTLDDRLFWSVRGKTPTRVARYIDRACIRWDQGDNNRLLPCDPPAEEDQLLSVLESYASDPDFIAELRAYVAFMAINVDTLSDIARALTPIRDLLYEELGETPPPLPGASSS